ncbi:alpha-rhamnosidase [Paenibacillus sp. J5C_2022]|uniref:alpha-L-rhamnosidase-related protein n=1 Tax=Paenibacillus sp. J5C2022 TaxID=2977129 RepID=UPI0021D277CD|nr:alpha-L-rhamnosidase C-terminal domain-containing protein [Paenibacillus sp. J5C2022]MCU6711975.1 alpha-rhamnosidase [Paenibacillus sp. J5C2022]
MNRAKWIWYPGDFELWLHLQVMMRRDERGMFIPPIWKVDSWHPNVKFHKIVELKEAETVSITANGRFNVMVNGTYHYNAKREFTLEEGKNEIVISMMNDQSLPTIFVSGPTVRTDDTWNVSYQNNRWTPAASWTFDHPDQSPVTYRLETERISPVRIDKQPNGMLLDFGKQTFGFVQLHGIQGKGHIHVYYGESPQEALSETHCETFDAVYMDNKSNYSFKLGRAFRYVYVVAGEGICVERVDALYEYLPVEYKGKFRCSNEVINEIWDVSVRTLHLNTREFFLDGIKRDRWVWSGDAYQSFLMNYYSFFDEAVCRRTLIALRGKDPVDIHLNTIMDYTFYWFISLYDYVMYTNDMAFIKMLYPKIVTLMQFCLDRTNDEGMMVGVPGEDWIFVDWADMGKDGALCVEQILFCRSLEIVEGFARQLGDREAADQYKGIASQLKAKVLNTFWDESQGGLVHSLAGCELNRHMTKYANLFTVLFGYLSTEQTLTVKQAVLMNDKVQKIKTPYMRFHELACLCEIGEQDYVMQEIINYWGAMLNYGATSFWEEYDPHVEGERQLEMYGRPFGKSLCHAWGASPIYLLGKYYLGVRPTSPGYASYVVEPVLGGLQWMEGSVPTPHGTVEVYMDLSMIKIRSASGNGVVRFRSGEFPTVAGGELRSIGDDSYELFMDAPDTWFHIAYTASLDDAVV